MSEATNLEATASQSPVAQPMRVAYADPPYPGMSGFYVDHPDFGGEVDHAALVAQLCAEYDAWILHTASTTLRDVLAICPDGHRVGAWVKTFASFKPGVNPAYAWEPVIFYGGRNDSSKTATTLTDWIGCPITLRRGLTGAKPAAVVEWALRMVGLRPDDQLVDLYPGTGAVGETWRRWRAQLALDAFTGDVPQNVPPGSVSEGSRGGASVSSGGGE